MENHEQLDPKSLVRRLIVGLVGLFTVVLILGAIARDPIIRVGAWFVESFGHWGLFISVLCIDTLPLTHEPVIFLAYSGGMGFVTTWLVASAGSVAGGLLGWKLGGSFGHVQAAQRWLVRYRIQDFLDRYGTSAIAVAALTPFPYAVATWAAGAAHVPFRKVALGTLFRIPKVCFYLSIMALGFEGC